MVILQYDYRTLPASAHNIPDDMVAYIIDLDGTAGLAGDCNPVSGDPRSPEHTHASYIFS